MKQFSLFLLCLITSNAYAEKLFSGFYANGAAGATIAQFNIDQTLQADVPGTVTLMRPADVDVQSTSFSGLFGFGYSYQFDSHFVLGAKFTAGWMHDEGGETNELNVTAFNIQLQSTVTASLNNDFALLFKPGYVFKEKTQLYALVGPRWGNFDTSVKTHFTFGNPATLAGDASDKTSGYVLGVTAGIGIERLVTDHFSVALEYAYTDYGDIPSPNTLVFLPTSPIEGTLTDEPELEAASNSLMVSLAYYF